MAPINFLPAVDGAVRRLFDASTAVATKSTRALPKTLNKLFKRQADGGSSGGGSDTGTQASTLSGGAIAGIVIGSIVGILLLYWIIRSCSNWSNPGGWGTTMEPEREKPARSSYYDPPRHRSRSRHSHHHHHSRSPRRIEVVQPVVYDPRGRSPRVPAAAYYGGGRSSHDGRDRRRSSDARRYSGH